jgi:hypothetical protein
MDGIEYTAEPDHMDDDDEDDGDESKSGLTDASKKGSMRQDGYRPRTYPGPAPHHTQAAFSSARSRDPSISSQAPLAVPHFNATHQVFRQSSMTESPKPISPRQPNDKTSSGASRANQFSGGSGRGTSPMNLPHPAASGTTQLPGLHNIVPPPPPQPQPQPAASHPSSMSSSHPGGSGSSTRELLGASGDAYASLFRDMEARINQERAERDAMIAQLRNDHARVDQERHAQIAQLKEEVERLKVLLSEQNRS